MQHFHKSKIIQNINFKSIVYVYVCFYIHIHNYLDIFSNFSDNFFPWMYSVFYKNTPKRIKWVMLHLAYKKYSAYLKNNEWQHVRIKDFCSQ